MKTHLRLLGLLLLLAPLQAWGGPEDRGDRGDRGNRGNRGDPRRTPVVEVFEASRNSVVNISSKQVIEYRAPRGIEDLFDHFFDSPRRSRIQRREHTSVGSGFVLHADGYIITNAHVVARTAQRKVIFEDKREFEAQIVAIDHEHDLAVLKIQTPEPLTPLSLGHSHDLMVGETVIAIGNPMGYQNTVTTGVISALGRSIKAGNNVSFNNLIQTDASINPGNSGGPLLNVLGELVGINTAIRADAQNIGFAIAVDDLRRLLPQMLSHQQGAKLNIGLQVSEKKQSLRIISVEVDSPAGRAGIMPGDTILEIDNLPVTDAVDYTIHMLKKQAGDTIRLQILRFGNVQQVTFQITEKPKPDANGLFVSLLGLEATTITPQMARKTGMPQLRGLVITKIIPRGPAAGANLRPGDVLLSLGRFPIRTLDEAGLLLPTVEHGQSVRMSIMRIQRRTYFRTDVILKTQ